jgi:hypothetical protein
VLIMKLLITLIVMFSLSACSMIKEDYDWCNWIDDDSFIEETPPSDLIDFIDDSDNLGNIRLLSSRRYTIWKRNNKGDFLACAPGNGFGAPACGATYDYFSKVNSQWVRNSDQEMIVMCHEKH